MAIETVRVKLNNEWTTLIYNEETGQYEAELTAPSHLSLSLNGGYYPIEVEVVNDIENVATANDRDSLFGENLRLFVDRLLTIYDRTEKDVADRLKKAFINFDDLNRIDLNAKEIATLLDVAVSVKTDWQMDGKPRYIDYERIKRNTAKIREAYATYKDTPQVPDRPYTTWQKWNDIERIIHDVFAVYMANTKNVTYCGESYCGEEGGLI